MRVMAPKNASTRTENISNHKNITNSCNDDDGMTTTNSCICLYKKVVKKCLRIAGKEDHVTIGRLLA